MSETHRSASCIFKRHLDTPKSRPPIRFSFEANLRAGNRRKPRKPPFHFRPFFLSFFPSLFFFLVRRNGKLEITTRRWSKGGPESAGARLFRCSIFLACRPFPCRRSTAFTRARNPGVRLVKLPRERNKTSLFLSLCRMEAWRFYRNRVLCDRPPFANDFGGSSVSISCRIEMGLLDTCMASPNCL